MSINAPVNTLAIDTSTEILSLCCHSGGGFIDLARSLDLRHAEELIPLIDWTLSQARIKAADLELVVASGGPGSFTGLRIGMATAKGIAAGTGCALVSVPSLDAYACRETVSLPLIDARKNRFYAAFYSGGRRLGPYMDATVEEICAAAEKYKDIVLTGPHAALFYERVAQCRPDFHGRLDPDAGTGKAAVFLRLGREAFLRGETQAAGLMYLREAETT